MIYNFHGCLLAVRSFCGNWLEFDVCCPVAWPADACAKTQESPRIIKDNNKNQQFQLGWLFPLIN